MTVRLVIIFLLLFSFRAGAYDLGSLTPEEAQLVTVRRVHFADVSASHWAVQPIEALASAGMIGGNFGGNFEPNRPMMREELANLLFGSAGSIDRPLADISRAEAVMLFTRFDSLTPVAVVGRPYPDVPVDHWAARWVTAAKKAGWLDFVGEKFLPNEKLTRAEGAALLYKTNYAREKLKRLVILD